MNLEEIRYRLSQLYSEEEELKALKEREEANLLKKKEAVQKARKKEAQLVAEEKCQKILVELDKQVAIEREAKKRVAQLFEEYIKVCSHFTW